MKQKTSDLLTRNDVRIAIGIITYTIATMTYLNSISSKIDNLSYQVSRFEKIINLVMDNQNDIAQLKILVGLK